MQERNIISGASATIFSAFVDGWESLIVWVVVALVLILADLRFGIEAAVKRNEKIRGSRVIRRTINKLVDYICWVSIAWVLGSSFGKIFNIPLLASIIMLVVYAIEISSIFDNYFESRGLNKKFNAIKFISKIFKIQAIEESFEPKNNSDETKNK